MIIDFEIKNGILYGAYPEGMIIDLDLAKQLVQERHSFVGDESYPVLIEGGGVNKVTKEARDYFSSKEAAKGISAAAIVANSGFVKYMANFLIAVNLKKVHLPMKVFSNTEEAIAWLENYKNEN